MKNLFFLIFTALSLSGFSQVLIDPAQNPTTSRINDGIADSYTASGTNSYSISVTGTFTYSYLNGKAVSVTFTNPNTTSSTLDFDGLGVKNIKKWSGGSLANVASGDLIGTIRLRYDGTQFVVESGAGGTLTSITATSPLSGGTITTSGSIGLTDADYGDITVTGGTTWTVDNPTFVTDATTARTISNSDRYKFITFTNAGAITITLNSTPDFGTTVSFIKGSGSGTITLSASGTYEGIDNTMQTDQGACTCLHKGSGNWSCFGALGVGGGGVGTVTNVSVTTANGVSGSVATATTTPAITLTLGAITPTTVNGVTLSGSSTPTLSVTGTTTVSGTHSGTSSGTNTGDQTITLTGAVTGSGTGSFATTIATPGTLTVSSSNSTATAHTHAVTSSSAPGAAASLLATDASGIIGSTGTRIVKGWFTDLTVTNAISGSITGNSATSTALATGRTIGITGDVTYTSPSFDGSGNVTASSTVTKINGTSLAGLGTGILKNTTGTGVPSIAVNSDLPVMTATVGGAVPTPPNNTTTFLRGDGTFATPSGSGDFSSNTSTSVDGEIVVFSGTGGKTGKRATGTGVAHITSGVLSAANVALASEVTGTLPVANGGTNITSYTSGDIIAATGSTTLSKIAVGSDGQVLTTVSGAPAWAAPNLTMTFGDGSDGDLTVTTSTATSGPITSGILTRDAYFHNLTINSSGSINTGGFRIFINGTLDISAAGADAITNTGPTGGNGAATTTGGSAPSNPVTSTIGGAPTARAGGASTTTTGSAATASVASNIANGGVGGTGRQGGSGASGSGGSATIGGTILSTHTVGNVTVDLIRGVTMLLGGTAGGGAGGGGGDGTAGAGGGAAGAGGGVLGIWAYTISRGGSTTAGAISSKGGNGGNGGTPGAGNRGGGGGGGAGGGGWIYLVYAYLTGSSATNCIDVSGGTGGNSGTGTGTGTNGTPGDGGSGGRVDTINTITQTGTHSFGSAGSAGSGTTGGAGNTSRVSL